MDSAAAVDDAVEGFAACLAAVVVVPVRPTVDRRFFASATGPEVDRVVEDAAGRVAGAVVEDIDILLEVVLGEAPLVVVVDAGLRVAVVVEAVAGLAGFEGDDAVAPGIVDVRRAAAEFKVDFLSSPDADGWDLWLAKAPAGFFTADAAGGRVGGLAKLDPALVAVAVDVRDEAVVPVAAGRRRVEVADPAGRFVAAGAPGLALLAVFLTGFAVSAAESPPVPAVPVVSSPERTDSSCWTTSKPSDSDMMLA